MTRPSVSTVGGRQRAAGGRVPNKHPRSGTEIPDGGEAGKGPFLAKLEIGQCREGPPVQLAEFLMLAIYRPLQRIGERAPSPDWPTSRPGISIELCRGRSSELISPFGGSPVWLVKLCAASLRDGDTL